MENRTKMTPEEKELLIKDLCARLPYGVKALETYYEEVVELITICPRTHNIEAEILSRIGKDNSLTIQNIQFFKPYLRPISSMTDEEFGFLQEHLPYDFTRIYSGEFDIIDDIHLGNSISIDDMAFLLDCLNKWHLDYRGLIPMGLALEAPEGMYNTKN